MTLVHQKCYKNFLVNLVKSFINVCMKNLYFLLALSIVSIAGCSTSKLTVNLAGSTVKDGIGAFYEESDFELARQGLFANIKLLEVLHKADPDNDDIRILLSQAYGGISYLFLDTELLNSPKDKEKTIRLGARMTEFYTRGLKYGLAVLQDDALFKKAMDKNDLDQISIQSKKIKNKEALFWTVFNWSLLLNMNRNSADRVVELPKIKILLEKMNTLDKTFFHGAPLALQGVIECSMPKMLGGRPQEGAKLMEEALKVSERKFLIIQLLYAQYCAPALQDKKLFNNLVEEIQNAPLGDGDVVLINNSVKLKTPGIKKNISELFIEE